MKNIMSEKTITVNMILAMLPNQKTTLQIPIQTVTLMTMTLIRGTAVTPIGIQTGNVIVFYKKDIEFKIGRIKLFKYETI